MKLGLDKSLVFMSLSGNVVKIVRKNGRRFIFSTHNPERLSKVINEIPKSEATEKGSTADA